MSTSTGKPILVINELGEEVGQREIISQGALILRTDTTALVVTKPAELNSVHSQTLSYQLKRSMIDGEGVLVLAVASWLGVGVTAAALIYNDISGLVQLIQINLVEIIISICVVVIVSIGSLSLIGYFRKPKKKDVYLKGCHKRSPGVHKVQIWEN